MFTVSNTRTNSFTSNKKAHQQDVTATATSSSPRNTVAQATAGEAVTIAARVRPITPPVSGGTPPVSFVEVHEGRTIGLRDPLRWSPSSSDPSAPLPPPTRSFDVDVVFEADSTTEEVFDTLLKPHILQGLEQERRRRNIHSQQPQPKEEGEGGASVPPQAPVHNSVCILAYGHTSSGKTHTIIGWDQVGLLPLCVELMLQWYHVLSFSMLEVYSERVFDLLVDDAEGGGSSSNERKVVPQAAAQSLASANSASSSGFSSSSSSSTFRRSNSSGAFVGGDQQQPQQQQVVKDLTTVQVQSVQEWFSLCAYGLEQRRTSATEFNDRSSRSHAMFFLSCGDFTVTLVDLAGSERSSIFAPVAAKDSIAINKSLSALSTVIQQLSSAGSKKLKQQTSKKNGGTRAASPANLSTTLSTTKQSGGGSAFRRSTSSSSSALREIQPKTVNQQQRDHGSSKPPTGLPQSGAESATPVVVPHVSFRDTTLTMLLERYLGGGGTGAGGGGSGCKTCFIACLDPRETMYQETLSSLRYVSRLKNVTTAGPNPFAPSSSASSAGGGGGGSSAAGGAYSSRSKSQGRSHSSSRSDSVNDNSSSNVSSSVNTRALQEEVQQLKAALNSQVTVSQHIVSAQRERIDALLEEKEELEQQVGTGAGVGVGQQQQHSTNTTMSCSDSCLSFNPTPLTSFHQHQTSQILMSSEMPGGAGQHTNNSSASMLSMNDSSLHQHQQQAVQADRLKGQLEKTKHLAKHLLHAAKAGGEKKINKSKDGGGGVQQSRQRRNPRLSVGCDERYDESFPELDVLGYARVQSSSKDGRGRNSTSAHTHSSSAAGSPYASSQSEEEKEHERKHSSVVTYDVGDAELAMAALHFGVPLPQSLLVPAADLSAVNTSSTSQVLEQTSSSSVLLDSSSAALAASIAGGGGSTFHRAGCPCAVQPEPLDTTCLQSGKVGVTLVCRVINPASSWWESGLKNPYQLIEEGSDVQLQHQTLASMVDVSATTVGTTLLNATLSSSVFGPGQQQRTPGQQQQGGCSCAVTVKFVALEANPVAVLEVEAVVFTVLPSASDDLRDRVVSLLATIEGSNNSLVNSSDAQDDDEDSTPIKPTTLTLEEIAGGSEIRNLGTSPSVVLPPPATVRRTPERMTHDPSVRGGGGSANISRNRTRGGAVGLSPQTLRFEEDHQNQSEISVTDVTAEFDQSGFLSPNLKPSGTTTAGGVLQKASTSGVFDCVSEPSQPRQRGGEQQPQEQVGSPAPEALLPTSPEQTAPPPDAPPNSPQNTTYWRQQNEQQVMMHQHQQQQQREQQHQTRASTPPLRGATFPAGGRGSQSPGTETVHVSQVGGGGGSLSQPGTAPGTPVPYNARAGSLGGSLGGTPPPLGGGRGPSPLVGSAPPSPIPVQRSGVGCATPPRQQGGPPPPLLRNNMTHNPTGTPPSQHPIVVGGGGGMVPLGQTPQPQQAPSQGDGGMGSRAPVPVLVPNGQGSMAPAASRQGVPMTMARHQPSGAAAPLPPPTHSRSNSGTGGGPSQVNHPPPVVAEDPKAFIRLRQHSSQEREDKMKAVAEEDKKADVERRRRKAIDDSEGGGFWCC